MGGGLTLQKSRKIKKKKKMKNLSGIKSFGFF